LEADEEEYARQQQLQPGEANLDTGVIAAIVGREGEAGQAVPMSHHRVISSFGDAQGEAIR